MPCSALLFNSSAAAVKPSGVEISLWVNWLTPVKREFKSANFRLCSAMASAVPSTLSFHAVSALSHTFLAFAFALRICSTRIPASIVFCSRILRAFKSSPICLTDFCLSSISCNLRRFSSNFA